MTVSISLKDVQNIKIINIKELGDFTVRRLGPGEEYDLSSKRRKMIKIADEMTKIKDEMDEIESPSVRDEFANANMPRIDKLSIEIDNIKKFELETYKRCFVDDSNGKKTDQLINSLTQEERMKLFGIIFDGGDAHEES